MERDALEQAAQIFADAVELAPGEQDAFILAACRGDEDILAEVRSLLDAAKDSENFFSSLASRLGAISTSRDDVPERPVVGEKGLTIGAYTLTRPVGSGGTGTVWRAERSDGQFDANVAIKLMHPSVASSAAIARLGREADHLARLSHGNIARLLDAGLDGENRPYLILEYVEGMPIDRYCDEHRLALNDRIRLFLSVLRAVGHAHANLIVHRDIKPANVMVDDSGKVKLLDFGIARLLQPDEGAGPGGMTIEVVAALTPEFAAPEQLTNQGITTATDIYSLGLLLYLLLVGFNPRQKQTVDSLSELLEVANQDLPKPSTIVLDEDPLRSEQLLSFARKRQESPESLKRQLRGDLDNILQKALANEPEDRYLTAAGFAADLERYLNNEPVTAMPPTLAYRMRKFINRHRGGVATALLVVIVLTTAVAVTTRQMLEARQQRDRAEQIQHFLVGLFAESDPNQSKGVDMTAREILDRGAERVDRELEGQTRVQADLLETIAGIYSRLSLSEEASQLLQQALAMRSEINGANSAEYAQVLENLALVNEIQGSYDEAESLATQALRIRRQLGDPIGTANAAMRLGSIYHRKSDLDTAEPLYREALSLARRNRAPGDLLPHALHQLGTLLEHRDKLAEALELHEEGLAMRRSIVGEEHLDLIESYYNVGSVQHGLERLDDAKQNYERALSISKKLTPGGNSDAAYMVNALAMVHRDLEEYPAAELRFREALELLHRYFEPGHPNIGIVSANLGLLLVETGDVATGESLLHSSLDVMSAAIPDHPKVPPVRIALGRLLLERSDYEAAEAMILAAHRSLQEAGADDPAHTQAAISALVATYSAWGRHDEAERYRVLLTDQSED